MRKGMTLVFAVPEAVDETELEAHVRGAQLQRRIEQVVFAEAGIDIIPAGRVVHMVNGDSWDDFIQALRDE